MPPDNTESTVIEQSADVEFEQDTLDADLESAIFGDGQTDDEINSGEEGGDTGETDQGEQQLEGDSEEGDKSTEENNQGENQGLEPPENWPAADKELFKKQTPEAQQWLLDRHKAMEADYTKKTQEIADIRREAEVFAPVSQGIKQLWPTNDPAALVNNWFQLAQHMEANPLQTLNYLAQQYKVDLTPQQQSAEQGEQGFVDPNVQQLQNTIKTLESKISQFESSHQQEKVAQQTQQRQEADAQAKAFAEEKTEAGELAHPFYEEVRAYMGQLLLAAANAGQPIPTLKELYESACYASPTVRQKMLDQQNAAQEAQRKKAEQERAEAARQKAEKSKRAASSISGSPGGTSPSADLSLDEELEKNFTFN